ncbi:MAG: hypothetical protein KGL39_28365 [Patescibacteria group bacterium]|nr:hypothetical protein [Patescibacteria group bacterium]
MQTLALKNTKTEMGLKSATVADLSSDIYGKLFISRVNAAIDAALASFDESRQKCLVVGQLLSDAKKRLDHGDFDTYVERHFPKLPGRTARRWVAAAENILRFLPPPKTLDIDVSVILTSADADLSGAARGYKQLLLNLNNNTTLKDAAAGVFVEGDDAHRISRAHNGKTKGGKGNQDRKDWPEFIGRKLSDIGTHLSHFKQFSAPQLDRTETLFKQNIAQWPSPVLEIIAREVREELKKR